MALFDSIREKTDSTTARLLFGAVCVVFVFSFIGIGMGGRTVTYAKVNGSRITDIDLQKKMRLVQRQQQYSSLNETELEELQEDVLESLIVERAVLQKAEDLDIEVSDEEVNFAILNIEGFKDASGDFSEELYEQAVKREGFGSKTKFEARTRQDLAYSKLRDLVISGIFVSDTEAKEQAIQMLTNVNVEWIRISKASVRSAVTVTDADIDAALTTDLESIQAEYNSDLERKYQKPERVSVARIVLPFTEEDKETVRNTATEIRQQAVDGTDFTSLVQQHSANKSNDGKVIEAAKDQLPSEVSSVVFSDSPPAISEVIETTEGFQIVQFLEKKDEQTTSFEDVKRDIARARLSESKLDEATKQEAQQVLTQWKTGFSETEPLTYTIDKAGPFSKAQPNLPGAGNAPKLLQDIRTTEASGFLDEVYETTSGYLVANITNIETPEESVLQMRSKQLKLQLERMRQQSEWDAFQQRTRQEASVDEIWKTWAK